MPIQTTGWLKVLTDRTLQLSQALHRLANLKNTWAETLANAQASNAPESIVQQIEAVIAAIDGQVDFRNYSRILIVTPGNGACAG